MAVTVTFSDRMLAQIQEAAVLVAMHDPQSEYEAACEILDVLKEAFQIAVSQ